MKNIFRSFILILLLHFISCSNKSNQELILGTWNVTSFKENNIERFNQLFTKYTWTFNNLQQVILFIRYPDNATDTFTTTYQITEEHLTFQGVQFHIDELTDSSLKVQGTFVDNETNESYFLDVKLIKE